MVEDELVREKELQHLKDEHRFIDREIQVLLASPASDDLSLARMKKLKLALRDQISRLEETIYPDITA